MQNIVFEKPYAFIPPSHSRFWPAVAKLYLRRYLRKNYEVHSTESRGAERLRALIDAGHGVLLTPNHCRPCDPLILGMVSKQLKINYYAMVGWHAFQQDPFTAKMLKRLGGFSVYREGMDRQSLNMAFDVLTAAKRPLIVFPEGAMSHHNDELMALMDGVSFIARTAAKRREKLEPPGKVSVLPVAIRYNFHGDLEKTLVPVLEEIESHFAWYPKKGEPLLMRIRAIGEACLALKEIEYFGEVRGGKIYDRVNNLVEDVLSPLEKEWKIPEKGPNAVARVKNLRTEILRDMVRGEVSEDERQRRWKQLAACYYAQQVSHYLADYVTFGDNVPEHVLETVERLEEDLTDEFKPHGPLHAVVQFGEPIEVSGKRDRKAAVDPIMAGIETQLKSMLRELAADAARRREKQNRQL